MIIEQPSKWLRWLYPSAIWRMDPKERAVYLTFDDGPIPQATPWILDTLDEYNAKATFFMVGDNVRKYPDLFQEIKSRGHSVLKADELINSRLFRPPHGWMRNAEYILLRHKFTIIMWDLVTRDYSKHLNADEVFENVRKYARNGSIITFHDSLKSIDKLKTALPMSLEWLRSQGYEFKAFDENMSWSRHLR